jgi:hypothetical protein
MITIPTNPFITVDQQTHSPTANWKSFFSQKMALTNFPFDGLFAGRTAPHCFAFLSTATPP